ncbi:MAG TPA: NAD(P)/FAD-dependent oxidoreductase [Candidatus Dormibacteraeota bacterium]|nr:NAD(P)/FAD-dependent oxidoreductase [Candidatus Dormibacteraeota bacterium]
MTPDTGTLVVGASAAGLAAASQLRGRGQDFEIVEAEDMVGKPWRRRYERLHLHTPRWNSSLPGLPMPREWDRYPARDQVAAYLESYRRHFDLRPHFGQRATRIERAGGGWETTTSKRTWRSRNVVVATGLTTVPVRPEWPGLDRFGHTIIHSSDYRNGEPWRGRPVLVVGFGNSGCEIALDLVERGASAHLSVRSPVNVIPRDVLGMIPVLQLGVLMRHLPTRVADALAWPIVRLSVGDVRTAGLVKLPYGAMTQIARDRRIPLLDSGPMARIRAGHIAVHGAVDHLIENGVVFADGSTLAVDAVIMATGYRSGLEAFLVDWREVCDEAGFPLRSGAPSGLEGLYFCGMYISPAGMFREIGLEAPRIAAHIATRPVTDAPEPATA